MHNSYSFVSLLKYAKRLVAAVVAIIAVVVCFEVYKNVASLHSDAPTHLSPSLKDPTKLRLIVIGDSGTGDENQYRVAGAMETYCLENAPIDGIVILGDVFYPNGIKAVDDPLIKKTLTDPYGTPCLAGVPFYPVLGNHDHKGSVEAFINYSKINPRWRIPARYYSVGFGSLLHLAVIDSSNYDAVLPFPGSFVSNSKEQLRLSKAPWKLLAAHHPPANACSNRAKREDPIRNYAISQAFCNAVDAYLGGHNHYLEHIDAPKVCAAPIFIVGGGGAGLREIEKCNKTKRFAASVHGFMSIEATADRISFAFINTDGTVLHQYQKQKI